MARYIFRDSDRIGPRPYLTLQVDLTEFDIRGDRPQRPKINF